MDRRKGATPVRVGTYCGAVTQGSPTDGTTVAGLGGAIPWGCKQLEGKCRGVFNGARACQAVGIWGEQALALMSGSHAAWVSGTPAGVRGGLGVFSGGVVAVLRNHRLLAGNPPG